MSVHRRFKHLAIDGMCSMAISVVCPTVPFKIRQSLLCAKSLKTLANRKLQFFSNVPGRIEKLYCCTPMDGLLVFLMFSLTFWLD